MVEQICALVFEGLPGTEHRTIGASHHHHAPGLHDVHGGHDDGASGRLARDANSVGILDEHICVPDGGRPALRHRGRLWSKTTDHLAVDVTHGVVDADWRREVFISPSEESGIELLSRGHISRQQVGPAETFQVSLA